MLSWDVATADCWVALPVERMGASMDELTDSLSAAVTAHHLAASMEWWSAEWWDAASVDSMES